MATKEIWIARDKESYKDHIYLYTEEPQWNLVDQEFEVGENKGEVYYAGILHLFGITLEPCECKRVPLTIEIGDGEKVNAKTTNVSKF